MSADGRFVAYSSASSLLVPNDTNDCQDIFVYDRDTEFVERVSVDSAGNQAGWHCFQPAISADGRVVAFRSVAGNLVPNDFNAFDDVFTHDRVTGVTKRVSVTSTGAEAHAGCWQIGCYFGSPIDISDDGSVVAFNSFLHDLVPNDTNGTPDVFVHDSNLGTTTLVSALSGVQGNWWSFEAQLSGDGNLVAFTSTSSNLYPGDLGAYADVFLHNRRTGATTAIDIDLAGQLASLGAVGCGLSRNGRYFAYLSDSPNLVAGDTNGTRDLFVHDLMTGTTRRATTGIGGQQVVAMSGGEFFDVGNDGSVIFTARQDGFVVGDTAIGSVIDDDALLNVPSLPSNALLGYCTPKTNSLNCVPRISVCGLPSASGEMLFSIIAVKVRSHEPG
ncbi:MAG: hypothetical protein IT454_05845, partial [Planctomycetes bacterium]|nr:hypothetical protein [Planctomycetota bacterium]